jgi:hypothetical protein
VSASHSLKSRDDVLRAAEKIARECGKPRNAHFNDASNFPLWVRCERT